MISLSDFITWAKALKLQNKAQVDAAIAAAGGGATSPAGSDKQVQYNDGGSFGAEAGFEYDKTTNRLKFPIGWVGSGTMPNVAHPSGDDPHWFEIVNDPSVLAGPSGFGYQMLAITCYDVNGYGGNVHFNRARGTEASPTALGSGDFIQSFGYRGYDGSGWSQSAAAFQVITTQAWTSSAHGCKISFAVTANGSTTRNRILDILSTGLDVVGDVACSGALRPTSKSGLPFEMVVAASDEGTALTSGTAKITFRMPAAVTLSEIRASLGVAQTSGSILTVDINESGTSILSTKLTVDNTEKTSTTAATAPVISDTSLADDAEMTVDIDQVGDGTAKGLKITLIGKYT
jgi:hypothetical protein